MGPRAGDALSKAEFAGSVNLAGCHAHEISDHPSVWPQKGAGKATHTYIHLDGFTYDRLAGGDHSAGTRKRWLDRQPPRHLGLEFRPQPFTQLVRVYREMGHEGRAHDIAKFKERRRRRARFIKLWHGWRAMPRFWQGLSGRNVFSSALDGILLAIRPPGAGFRAYSRLGAFCARMGRGGLRRGLRLRLFPARRLPAGALVLGRRHLRGRGQPGRFRAFQSRALSQQGTAGEVRRQLDAMLRCAGGDAGLQPVYLLAGHHAARARPWPEARLAASLSPGPADADGPAKARPPSRRTIRVTP